jgi:hypothetical protein
VSRDVLRIPPAIICAEHKERLLDTMSAAVISAWSICRILVSARTGS